MPLIYVTGPAGSGKSAIAQELRRRGYAAYDEDDPDIGSAHHMETGRTAAMPPASERDHAWLKAHEWRVLDKAMASMTKSAITDTVFLCGNSIKDEAIWCTFDKVIYLRLDKATLKRRIDCRTDNDYGKCDEEFITILGRHKAMENGFAQTAAIPVDANQPLGDVVDAIISVLPL